MLPVLFQVGKMIVLYCVLKYLKGKPKMHCNELSENINPKMVENVGKMSTVKELVHL